MAIELKKLEEIEVTFKRLLVDNENFGGAFYGTYRGEHYHITFKLSDLEVLFRYESADKIIDDTDFKLEKPLCIIYASELESGKDPGSNPITIEFQLIVNAEPLGKLYLNGYSELLSRFFLDDESGLVFKEGIKAMTANKARIFDGETLSSSLKNRILLQSLIFVMEVLN